MEDRPNILFVLTDQQNANMMSCAGNGYVNTPAIDSLALGGVRFNRAYCTNPVCIASRFSLMTGLMPSTIGMLSNSTADIGDIPDSIKRNCLGFLMRKAGYDVAYAGKVHLPGMSAKDAGFDYICGDERNQMPHACVEFIRKRRSLPFFLVASFINPHDICYMAIRDFMKTEHDRQLLDRGALECASLDLALARPEKVDEAKFFSEHCPPLPPNFEPQSDEPEAIRIMLDKRPFRMEARLKWNENRWREHRWAYARLTEMVDKEIGRILDALGNTGQTDNTLVVFTSDHGDMDSSHRMEHKSSMYDEACHIPLIIRPPGPGSAGGAVSEQIVSNGLDLLPTLCDYAGIPAAPELPGKSLRPIVEGVKHDFPNRSIPVESAIGRGVFTDRFKYMMFDLGTSREQLIDKISDPFEQRNALNDHKNQDMLEKLRNNFHELFGNEMRNSSDILRNLVDS